LMSTLKHPNIVSLKGFCFEPYTIIMEFMDQGSLTSFLRKQKSLDVKVQYRLALDIAKGMQFLHGTSPPLVHRDLKSPNVLMQTITDFPNVMCKVSDFGLSRTSVSGFVSKVVQNPIWCAPEILKDEEYDERADVYSFGIILWEFNTRKFPFDEYDFKFGFQLEDAIIGGTRPTIPSDCPEKFSKLIQDCWNANPSSRPLFSQIVKNLEELEIAA